MEIVYGFLFVLWIFAASMSLNSMPLNLTWGEYFRGLRHHITYWIAGSVIPFGLFLIGLLLSVPVSV